MTTDLIDVLERRSVAFSLASRLVSAPDAENLGSARRYLAPLANGAPEELRLAELLPTLGDSALAEFTEVLDANRLLNEADHVRPYGMIREHALADLSGFYTAFGVAPIDAGSGNSMVDHLMVELEFYGSLLVRLATVHRKKEAREIALITDACTQFIADHLSRFLPYLAKSSMIQSCTVYRPIIEAVAGLVRIEAERLGATDAPIDAMTDAMKLEKRYMAQ
jgi:hypothetical protein